MLHQSEHLQFHKRLYPSLNCAHKNKRDAEILNKNTVPNEFFLGGGGEFVNFVFIVFVFQEWLLQMVLGGRMYRVQAYKPEIPGSNPGEKENSFLNFILIDLFSL